MKLPIHYFKLVAGGFHILVGRVYSIVKHAKGVFGCHLVPSRGTHPYQAHVSDPEFRNPQGLSMMAEGGMLTDTIVCLAAIDPVIGGVDR